VDKVVDLTFFHQPNDIAVTLASIKSVSSDRSPQPRILSPDAACDHLTYFTSKAGLDVLAMALRQSQNRDIQPQKGPDSVTNSLIQEPDQNTGTNSSPTSQDTTNQQTENRSGINGIVIGVIALLVAAVVGLIFVSNRSPQPQPTTHNRTSQSLVAH
jgi:hypothetical protein